MIKYYMFSIQKKYQKYSDKDSKALFQILENLYNLDISKVNYGVSIYNQLCKRIDTKTLLNFFKEKYPNYQYINNRIINNSKEKALLEVDNCCLVLYTTAHISTFFKNILICDATIFVCDFDTSDYFWLKKTFNYK